MNSVNASNSTVSRCKFVVKDHGSACGVGGGDTMPERVMCGVVVEEEEEEEEEDNEDEEDVGRVAVPQSVLLVLLLLLDLACFTGVLCTVGVLAFEATSIAITSAFVICGNFLRMRGNPCSTNTRLSPAHQSEYPATSTINLTTFICSAGV